MNHCANCGHATTDLLFEGRFCSIDCSDEWDDNEQ